MSDSLGQPQKVEIENSTSGAEVLSSAPGSDSGQRALAVRVVSSLAAAGGGGTQYAEDTASTAAEQVTMAGVVRKDARASLVDTDGDRTELQVNASGDLRVDGSAVTQPVSGTITANAGTGTFTVSGTVTANAGTGPFPVSDNSGSLTVDGTFWPTTSAAPNSSRLSDGTSFYDAAKTGQLPTALGANGGLKVEGIVGGVAQPVSGTFWQATQPVSGTFWQATQPVSGTVAVTGTFWQATQPVSGTVTVTPPTLTKGTQGSTGLSTQDLKDAGRSAVTLCWEEMAGTAAAESTLTNFTSGQRAGSALTAATNLAVTAGKTLRIQAVNIYVKATSTVNNLARFRIRQAASVANNSPIIFDHVLGLEVTGTIAAGAFHDTSIAIPDGLEVAAGQQITFTWFTAANTCTVGMTIIGYEY